MLSIQGSDVLNYINAQKENGKEVNLGTNEGVYIAKGRMCPYHLLRGLQELRTGLLR